MFARKVSVHLKANGAAEFKKKIESEVIPLLRKQAGFLDEITFLYPSAKERRRYALGGPAETGTAYTRDGLPEATSTLAPETEARRGAKRYGASISTAQNPP